MRSRIAAAVAVGLLAPGWACARRTAHPVDDSPGMPQPVASAETVPVPVDHLAPGELVEGTEQAFGVKLPRGMRVKAAFIDVVYAQGPVLLHPAVAYFRARLRDGGLHEGDEAATFEHVHVPGKPGIELNVRVEPAPGGLRVVMRDTTPAPLPALPDDAARRRAVGLTPDGRLLNPTHLD
jgi:hypothetical protein